MNHPWLKDRNVFEEKTPEIFSEPERHYIEREFVFKDEDIKIGESIKSLRAAMEDCELNLADFENNTLESEDDPEKDNVSSKSSVLGPYNSLENDEQEFDDMFEATDEKSVYNAKSPELDGIYFYKNSG